MEEGQDPEEGTLHRPAVVFEGRCDHRYVPHSESEGMVVVRCSKCPMGNAYDPVRERLVGGRIILADEQV